MFHKSPFWWIQATKIILKAGEDNLVSSTMAAHLIEAQAACGNIVDPLSGDVIDVQEAIDRDLVAAPLRNSVQRAYNLGFRGVDDDGSRISLTQAIENKRIAERSGLRYIDAQVY